MFCVRFLSDLTLNPVSIVELACSVTVLPTSQPFADLLDLECFETSLQNLGVKGTTLPVRVPSACMRIPPLSIITLPVNSKLHVTTLGSSVH
uniref:Uncharacterized protein n=1 Tax=Arundo donax TaxID=35708 RepID=A0A0A8YNW0_ARUDO